MSSNKLLFLFSICSWASLNLSCGGDQIKGSPPNIDYYLERPNTNQTYNDLVISMDQGEEDYTFSVGGIGFDYDLALDKDHPIQRRSRIRYPDEAIYTLEVTIYNKAGLPFIRDSLSWEYSLEVPDEPILGFSEEASSDQDVKVILGGRVSTKTTEIKISGDIENQVEARWLEIPSNLRVPIRLSAEDGLKKFEVTYRNIYGNESASVPIEIIKKSSNPSECTASIGASIVNSRNVRVYFSAKNDGLLYQSMSGDIDTSQRGSFTDSGVASVRLSPDIGEKIITVKIEDAAKNICEPIDLRVTYDPNESDFELKVENDSLWTDSININIVNRFQFLPSDSPQMYIHGPHVVETDQTQKWVDFKELSPITLTEIEGQRDIYAQYRRSIEDEPTKVTFTHIYLRPYISYQNSSVQISDITELNSVTITGCIEAYSSVGYQANYPCTPNASKLQAVFTLSTGERIEKELNVP